jgi:hypothetical protein
MPTGICCDTSAKGRRKDTAMPVVTKKEFELHPEGLFEATILEIHEDVSTYGPVYKIRMQTDAGEAEMLCSTSYTPNSRFGELVRAVFGKPFAECPETLDTDRLAGSKVRAFVEHNVTDRGTWARVTKCKSLGDLFADE